MKIAHLSRKDYTFASLLLEKEKGRMRITIERLSSPNPLLSKERGYRISNKVCWTLV